MPSNQLDKTYRSNLVEDKWYEHWIEQDYFTADSSSEKEPYTIVIPPPNVTGMLTVGHVLNNTIQDILIRKHVWKEKKRAGFLLNMHLLLRNQRLWPCSMKRYK